MFRPEGVKAARAHYNHVTDVYRAIEPLRERWLDGEATHEELARAYEVLWMHLDTLLYDHAELLKEVEAQTAGKETKE